MVRGNITSHPDYFIHKAIRPEHKGKLRKFAEQHKTLTKKGTIDLDKTEKAAQRLKEPARTHRLKEINLARTLKRLRSR